MAVVEVAVVAVNLTSRLFGSENDLISLLISLI